MVPGSIYIANWEVKYVLTHYVIMYIYMYMFNISTHLCIYFNINMIQYVSTCLKYYGYWKIVG